MTHSSALQRSTCKRGTKASRRVGGEALPHVVHTGAQFPISPRSPCPPVITALVPGATQWAALQMYFLLKNQWKMQESQLFLKKKIDFFFFFLASILHFPGKSHRQCLLHLNAVLVPRTTSLPTHLVYYLPELLSHWNLNPASWW